MTSERKRIRILRSMVGSLLDEPGDGDDFGEPRDLPPGDMPREATHNDIDAVHSDVIAFCMGTGGGQGTVQSSPVYLVAVPGEDQSSLEDLEIRALARIQRQRVKDHLAHFNGPAPVKVQGLALPPAATQPTSA